MTQIRAATDDEAELYLSENGWILEQAVKAWKDDEAWENSPEGKSKLEANNKAKQQQPIIKELPKPGGTPAATVTPLGRTNKVELTDAEVEAQLKASQLRHRKSYGSSVSAGASVPGGPEPVELTRLQEGVKA